MKLIREYFHAIIFHNFRRGLSQQECIDELTFLYVDKASSYNNIILARAPEIGQGIGRILSCRARKPKQT